MTLSIKQLDHVVLRVSDLDRAIAFYSDIFGCEVERRVERIKLVQMRAGHSLIDLIAKDPDEGLSAEGVADKSTQNMDHFALRIDPFDPEAIRRHLDAHGVACGAVESRYGAEGTGPSIYIEDPDGNTVELKGPADA